MNLHQLRIFLTVSQLKSYSKAADALRLSQPTVSVQIKRLEQDLGIELFEQLGKRIYLTPAGEILQKYASRILTLIELAEFNINELKGLKQGRLLIGASTTPGIYLLPSLLGKFKGMYPGIEISLDIANSQAIQEKLLENTLDLAVVGEESHHDNDICLSPLFTDQMVVICSPQHPWAHRSTPVTLEELAGETFILREQGSSTRETAERSFIATGFQPLTGMQLSSSEAIKQAVAANLGISIISKFAVSLELNTGVLTTLQVPDLLTRRQFYLIYHREKRHSQAALAFIGLLQQFAAQYNSQKEDGQPPGYPSI